MNKFGRSLALWVIIGLLLIALFNLFQGPVGRGSQSDLAYTDFLSDVDQGRVADVEIQGKAITGHYDDGRPFNTYAPDDPGLIDRSYSRSMTSLRPTE